MAGVGMKHTATLDVSAPHTWPVTLTRSELAQIRRVSLTTLDRLRRQGLLPRELPGTGRQPMWSREVVIRYWHLEQHKGVA